MLGERLDAHPGTEDVGKVWGFGDLSGVIQTQLSVSFLNDGRDVRDRLVGIGSNDFSNQLLCTENGFVTGQESKTWGERADCGVVDIYFTRLKTVIFAKTAGASDFTIGPSL